MMTCKMKRKFLLLMCTVFLLGTAACHSTETASQEDSTTTTNSSLSSTTTSSSNDESQIQHVKKELDTNLLVDADVILPAKNAYSTYTMVNQSFTSEELSQLFLNPEDKVQILPNTNGTDALNMESSNGSTIVANGAGIYYKKSDRDSTIDTILNEYYTKHKNDISENKDLSFLDRADAIKQGADFLRSLHLSCEPADEPTVVALTADELSAFQSELLKDDNYRNFPKTEVIENWTEQDDVYQLRFTFEKDGIPVYGSAQEPNIVMHYDDPYSPLGMYARMTITSEGISYLNVMSAYSLSGQPSDPQTIISVDDALNALKKSYSDVILSKPHTVKKIFLEYIPKQDPDTTYKNARYSLIPYWCLEIDDGDILLTAERFNALTGEDLAYGG
jgi:hypothetical protein